jgi:archaellum component FlaF (FlaF/FlaG flagellin family)
MGFSTMYANIVMFAFFMAAITLLIAVFSTYMGDSSMLVGEQADMLKERLETRVSVVEVSTSTSDDDVRVYVVNDGRTNLETGCVDFYINREYVKHSDMDELVLENVTYDPGVWNPGETLKMRVAYGGRGEWNEARVVTCNGVSDSALFFGAG